MGRLAFAGVLRGPRLYVYGDGTVWRYDEAAMRSVLAGVPWARAGRVLRGARMNYHTGRWTGLPVDLYQGTGSSRLGSARNGVHVIHYDDGVEEACRMLLGGAR